MCEQRLVRQTAIVRKPNLKLDQHLSCTFLGLVYRGPESWWQRRRDIL